MGRGNITLASVVAGSLLLTGSTALMPISHACAAQAQASYSEDIEPILRGWCVSCHQPGGEGSKASGLDLTTYEGVMKGTKFGPMVIPGKPDESNLMVLDPGGRQDTDAPCPQAAAQLSSPEHLDVDLRGREKQLIAAWADAPDAALTTGRARFRSWISPPRVTRSGEALRVSRKALLAPGIAVDVVAAELPEPGLVAFGELQGVHPLRRLPEIEVRHQETRRAAMVRRDRCVLIG